MLPDMTSTSQQESKIDCFVPMPPYSSTDPVTVLQHTNGEVFDAVLPEVTNAFHPQPMISCFVQMPSYPLPCSFCPVSPLAPIVPYVYSNDSGVLNIEDINSTSQSPNPVPIGSGSSLYCDIPSGYGTPYPYVTNTSPVMPLSKLSPLQVKDLINSEVLDSPAEKSNSDERCMHKCPTVSECSSQHHVSLPCPLATQGEDGIETATGDCMSTPSITGLLPECAEDGFKRPQTPVPAVEDVKEDGPDSNKESKFGVDGYWHSFSEDINESSLDAVPNGTSHQAVNCLKENSEQQEHDVHDLKSPSFIPSLLHHMMPPPPYGTRLSPRQKTVPPRSKPSSPRGIPSPIYNIFHHVNLPESILGRPRLLPTLCKGDQLCVEEVWKMHMVLLFKNFRDEWVLNAVGPGNKCGNNWNSFKDLAKVRFYCRSCRDGWTSMYGVVIFYYKLDFFHFFGQILYEIPGQKCRNCKPKVFEVPLWYPEEAQKVITNLYYKIGAHCYNLTTPQFIRSRRQGQPLTYHNELLCQGCCHGVCKNDCNKDE
ncbi:uncharacterized protein [Panulirus ornatus]|uniref:uncharacterized protein n=1 Tax=Panulirus ornatus TaxID=150431 RepID=UPI003A8C6F6B